MRVFVTGASGHIGTTVVRDLVEAGHDVLGLARSDESATAVKELGAQVQRGGLADTEALRDAAAWADGVIHLAFDHAQMRTGDLAGAASTDLAAVRAMGAALAGTGKALAGTGRTMRAASAGTGKVMVGVSGTLSVAGLGRTATEDDQDNPAQASPRSAVAAEILGLADRGVRASVVRVPPVVHSDLDRHGFMPTLIRIARENGVSGYVGDGTNRWAAGHARDVARVFRLALEKAPSGARLHPVGDEGVPTKAIAETIGRNLGLPVDSVPAQEVARFTFLAPFMTMDNPTSNARTREMLGWAPAYPGLIADLDGGHYFAGDK